MRRPWIESSSRMRTLVHMLYSYLVCQAASSLRSSLVCSTRSWATASCATARRLRGQDNPHPHIPSEQKEETRTYAEGIARVAKHQCMRGEDDARDTAAAGTTQGWGGRNTCEAARTSWIVDRSRRDLAPIYIAFIWSYT